MLGPVKIPAAPITTSPFLSVDGRHSGRNQYAVGGDAGLFFTALSLYELELGRELTKAETKAALASLLKTMGQAYLPFTIDSNAKDFLVKAAGIQTLNLEKPPKDKRAKLLEYVGKPQAQGDQFFSMVLKYPSKFGLKSKLAQIFAQSLFELLWEASDNAANAKPKIKLIVLSGEHTEKVFVDTRLGSACITNKASIPFSTKNDKLSAFVHSFDAAVLKLQYMGQIVVNQVSHGKLQEARFLTRLKHRYLASFNQFGLLVASNLCFYTVQLLAS